MEYYYSFKNYLKKLHNKKIWRVPLSTGYPCPNRINSYGCTFCNGRSFIADYMSVNNSLKEQLEKGIAFFGKKFDAQYFYGYFQDNSGTYGKTEDLADKYEFVLSNNKILGLIISTRPDCINDEILKKISVLKQQYGKDIWIEIGLQTIYNKTLKRINRNHDYNSFKKSIEIINMHKGINTGVHMIIGLPGENPENILNGFITLFKENNINGLKIRLLDILPDTHIYEDFINNKADFYFFTNREYVELICSIMEHIPENTVILRTLNYNPVNILNKDKIILNKDQILLEIRKEFLRRGTKQGYYFNS